jgi:hypothetical protein
VTRNITEHEWDVEFGPLDAPSGSQMWQSDEIPFGTPVNRLWTWIEGEGGQLFVLNGSHVVNAIAYMITERPYEGGVEIIVTIEGTSDKDKAVEEIALILWWDHEARQWNVDKEWNSATASEIAQVMIDRGLAPVAVTEEEDMSFVRGSCPTCGGDVTFHAANCPELGA